MCLSAVTYVEQFSNAQSCVSCLGCSPLQQRMPALVAARVRLLMYIDHATLTGGVRHRLACAGRCASSAPVLRVAAGAPLFLPLKEVGPALLPLMPPELEPQGPKAGLLPPSLPYLAGQEARGLQAPSSCGWQQGSCRALEHSYGLLCARPPCPGKARQSRRCAHSLALHRVLGPWRASPFLQLCA